MTSFFHFVNKPAIYLNDKFSLANAAHLSQAIKSQNKIIYIVVNILNNQHI
jgi:hypothetical protein